MAAKGDRQKGNSKEKDVRMSNIMAAKGKPYGQLKSRMLPDIPTNQFTCIIYLTCAIKQPWQTRFARLWARGAWTR